MRILLAILLTFATYAHAGFWDFDKSLNEKNIDYWQPDTVEDFSIPENPLNLWNYDVTMLRSSVNYFERIIPTYNNKGTLFASWTPSRDTTRPRPTVIITHGGHGVTPNEIASAMWFQKNVNANVLILDSFWSRGRLENFATMTKFGANVRVLDVIASVKWLNNQPEVDAKTIYLYGGSQGGWTSLRAMTDDPFIKKELSGKIAAAFSLYPVCANSVKFGGNFKRFLDKDVEREHWLAPQLGPYYGKVYVFTGGKDTGTDFRECNQQVFTTATEWMHFPNATHAWDIPNRGLGKPVDGECSKALNIYNKFSLCRDNKVTDTVLEKIKSVILNR